MAESSLNNLQSCFVRLLLLALLLVAAVAHALESPLKLTPRPLTVADEAWLKRQALTSATQNMTPITLAYRKTLPAPKPLALNERATPRLQNSSFADLAIPLVTNGVSMEVSGQIVTLPKLELPSFANSSFNARLKAWLTQDLQPLSTQIRKAQSLTGWSDWEVLLLVQRYAATLLPAEQQLPFIASFWHQLDYQVQFAFADQQPLLFWRVEGPVYGVSLLEHASGYWFGIAESQQEGVRFPQTIRTYGQAIRVRSLTDRSRSTQSFWVTYKVAQKPSAAYEVPAHWRFIPRLPATPEMAFRISLPTRFFQQIAAQLPDTNGVAKTQQFAAWLKTDFKSSNDGLSLYQALAFKELNDENRRLLLALWWRFLNGQPAALLETESQNLIALKLPPDMTLQNSVRKRKQDWWLFSAELEPLASVPVDARWRFLP